MKMEKKIKFVIVQWIFLFLQNKILKRNRSADTR